MSSPGQPPTTATSAIRDPVSRFDGGTLKGKTQADSNTELSRVFGAGRLILHYQPQLDLTTGRIATVETLVRWDEGSRGLLLPAVVVPAAEAAGLASLLTKSVIELALDQCAEWSEQGLHIPVTVNLSRIDLADPHLTTTVVDALIDRGLDAKELSLEIPENTIVDQLDRALTVIESLRTEDIGVSIDDFGAAHGSLRVIRELPVNELKLAPALMGDVATEIRTAAVTKAVIDLAHVLGIRVAAKRVETEATARTLTDFGCDAIQGYFLSTPQPASELTPWLQLQNLASFTDIGA
jgi:diguanylate cyclase